MYPQPDLECRRAYIHSPISNAGEHM
eukprot:COSAG06_NODE_4761_length_3975_cov_7.211042_5_plen_25_part_01